MHETNLSPAIVRIACLLDIPVISELIERVWSDPGTDMKCLAGERRLGEKELPSFFEDSDNLTLVHALDDVLSGVLFLTRVAPTVFDLGVVATPPGHGAGTRLIDAAIDLSFRDGVTTEIYLDVFSRNPAVHLYKRKGFEEYDQTVATNQRGELLPMLRMRKSIRAFALSRASKSASSHLMSGMLSFLPAPYSVMRRTFTVIRKLAAGQKFL
jgi:GNAT superfamily N-acetyltransferase